MEDIKCTICGNMVEYEEAVNVEYVDGIYYELCRGYCKNCKKWYLWNNIYTFSKTEYVMIEED